MTLSPSKDPTYALTLLLSFRRIRIEQQYLKETFLKYKTIRPTFLLIQQIIFHHFNNEIYYYICSMIIFTYVLYSLFRKMTQNLSYLMIIISFSQYIQLTITPNRSLHHFYFSTGIYSIIFYELNAISFKFKIFYTIVLWSIYFSNNIICLKDLLLLIPIHIFINYIFEKFSRDQFKALNESIRSEYSYKQMIEELPSSILILGRNNLIESSNNQANTILKKSVGCKDRAKITNSNFISFFDKKHHDIIRNALNEARNEGTSELLNVVILIKEEENESESPMNNILTSSPNTQKSFSPTPSTNSIVKNTLQYGKSINIFPLSDIQVDTVFRKKKYTEKTFNLHVKRLFWKGKVSLMIILEDNEKQTKIIEFLGKQINTLNTTSNELIELIEKDYQKWNNLQSMKGGFKDIKESDLKDLSTCVIEVNLLRCYICSIQRIIELTIDSDKRFRINFNIKNTLIQCMELISTKILEKNSEITLRFEESFPDTVHGDYESFKHLILILLRILIVSPLLNSKKSTNKTMFAKLRKSIEDNSKFLLAFEIEFEKSSRLEDHIIDLISLNSENMKQPSILMMNLLTKSGWNLENLSIIPLLTLLEGEFSYIDSSEGPNNTLILEIPFSTTELSVLSHSPESNATSIILNKKPLSLSFCRIMPNANYYGWKVKPTAMNYPSKNRPKKGGGHVEFNKTALNPAALLLSKEKDQLSRDKENEIIDNLNKANDNLNKATPSFEFIQNPNLIQDSIKITNNINKENEINSESHSKNSSPQWKPTKIESKMIISGPNNIKNNLKSVIESENHSASPIDRKKYQNRTLIPISITPSNRLNSPKLKKSSSSEKNDVKINSFKKLPEKIQNTLDEWIENNKDCLEKQIIRALSDILNKEYSNNIIYHEKTLGNSTKLLSPFQGKRNKSLLDISNEREIQQINSPKSSLLHKKNDEKNNRSFTMVKRLNLMLNLKKPSIHEITRTPSSNHIKNDLNSKIHSLLSRLSTGNINARHLELREQNVRREWKYMKLDRFLIIENESLNIGNIGGAYIHSELTQIIKEINGKNSIELNFVADFKQVLPFLKMKNPREAIFTLIIIIANEQTEKKLIENVINDLRNFEKRNKDQKTKIIMIINSENTIKTLENMSRRGDIDRTIFLNGKEEDKEILKTLIKKI